MKQEIPRYRIVLFSYRKYISKKINFNGIYSGNRNISHGKCVKGGKESFMDAIVHAFHTA